MRIFFSVGEPSGDLHGANLIRTLQAINPRVCCIGYGGERMRAAGCDIHYPLCSLSIMGFLPVLLRARQFVGLIRQADQTFERHRPDAVVLVDYPGFNWWIARKAHARGIPVFYFVPPQLWAWAGWRVRKMQRFVDHVLCTLPFELPWYQSRGVQAHYVGHPYFDELPQQQLDLTFLAEQRTKGGTIIGLLPGSRTQEVVYNLPTLIGAAEILHHSWPDVRFLVACYKQDHLFRVQQFLDGLDMPFIEPCVSRTPEIIHLAHSCVAVSGSVSLELLYRARPSVVIYRANPVALWLSQFFRTCRFISLVNLLADRPLYPELLSSRCEAPAAAHHVLHWLREPAAYQTVREELITLREQLAQPGACERTAQYILDVLDRRRQAPRAA